jgi:hypothetical protein
MADGAALAAYWLPVPGLELELHERGFGPGHVALQVPELKPHALRELLAALRRQQAAVLAERPVASLLEAIEAASRLLTSPGAPLREELVDVLPRLTGYSSQMIGIGLEHLARGWTAAALGGVLAAEFGSLEALDTFQRRTARGWQRVFGPALTVHIFSGNIPGVSVTSLIRALCVKSASFGKTAAGEPYFAVCFARALAEVDAELAGTLAVSYWAGGAEDLEAVAFSEAGAVIAFGSDDTVRSVACRVPAGVRFLGYPNRVGAALIGREALTSEGARQLAGRAALDVATFDQQGCVSPHTIYVERGGEVDPLDFGRALAAELERLAAEIPRGSLSPGESTLIHQLRAQAEVRGGTVLASARGTAWTVVVEERAVFEASPLNRVIFVCSVDDLSTALAALQKVGRRLQTAALAAGRERIVPLAARLGALGATRIVPIGEAAWPSPDWHHDGRFQFLDLVRFVDLETRD